MKYHSFSGKTRLYRQRMEMLHTILYVVIILCGILLFIDVERFFGLFCVIFFLGAGMSFERGMTGNPEGKGKRAQSGYILLSILVAGVLLTFGILSLILTFRL